MNTDDFFYKLSRYQDEYLIQAAYYDEGSTSVNDHYIVEFDDDDDTVISLISDTRNVRVTGEDITEVEKTDFCFTLHLKNGYILDIWVYKAVDPNSLDVI